MKNALLHRDWLEFDASADAEQLAHRGVLLGCGVTAFTVDDAVGMVREHLFRHQPMPPLARVIEDVDITTLDTGHVRPNMNEPVSRGIWYPMGCRPAGGSR